MRRMSALEMLRSAADFQQIQGQSRTRAHPALLIRYRPNGLDRTRYGISTGRRVGSAVVRNKVRRRLRTILRQLEAEVKPGWDILIVTRPAAAQATQTDLGAALTRVMASAGLLTGHTTGTN
jgi:ribonuclease P protein component